VPGCPAHVLLPLLVLFYNMFEQINNQLINQSINSFAKMESIWHAIHENWCTIGVLLA